jgi:hypothetical protein
MAHLGRVANSTQFKPFSSTSPNTRETLMPRKVSSMAIENY